MDPGIHTLVEEFWATSDLDRAQALALELVWTVYQRLGQIQMRLAKMGPIVPNGRSDEADSETQI